MTNVFPFFQGSGYINQVIITAPSNIAQVAFIDTPTNALTYTNAPYTGRYSYATNYISSWTNFYGVAASTTNIALIDATNTIAATTNTYPVRFTLSSTSGGSAAFPALNSYFASGVWATNLSTNTAIITIVGHTGE
jgi:hypothetical protein